MKTRHLIIALTALAFASCGSGKFTSPEVDMPQSYIYAGTMDTLNNMVNISWWEEFDDPVLSSLIVEAMVNNKDIVAAMSALEQARLYISTARAAFLPSVDLSGSGEAKYNDPTKIVQTYGIQANMSWEVSLFGEMKNTTRAARAAYLSTEQATKAVMLSVAAEVATTYFTLMGYRSSLEISRRSYQLRKESADLIDSLFYYGMASELNLEQALSLTAAAAADIPMYERAIMHTSLALSVLLGKNPSYTVEHLGYSFTKLGSCSNTIPQIPIGVPSSLLERRPDIMEAYYDMAEGWANVGIARAQRYPSISLTAGGGVGSSLLKNLLSGKPLVWSSALALTQPIFAFSANKKNVEIAREKFYASTAQYEQTVLTALAEVEKSLAAVSTYKRQLEKYANLLNANYKAQQMTSSLYKNGLNGYLDVIDAERTWYQSQLQYVNILTEQYINYISLYKALGGGW